MEQTASIDVPPGDGVRERFDRIYSEIRLRICMLDYAPGLRLSEEALAREFGVSRTPLRRVLGRLETEGLVQSMHGVGTMVTDVDLEELTQVYKLRLELATLAGRLDPVMPDAGQMEELELLALRSKQLMQDPAPRAFARLNMEFFVAHLALSGNVPLRAISERLYYRTSRIWLKSLSASQIDLSEEAYIFDREIEDVVAALRIGDLEAAALVRRAHISMSFTRMKRNSGHPPPGAPGASGAL